MFNFRQSHEVLCVPPFVLYAPLGINEVRVLFYRLDFARYASSFTRLTAKGLHVILVSCDYNATYGIAMSPIWATDDSRRPLQPDRRYGVGDDSTAGGHGLSS